MVVEVVVTDVGEGRDVEVARVDPLLDERMRGGLDHSCPDTRVHHLLDQLLEGDLRLPFQLFSGFARVGQKKIHFGRPVELRIYHYMALPVETNPVKRDLHKLLDAVRLTGAGGFMPSTVACPACHGRLRIMDEWAGQMAV